MRGATCPCGNFPAGDPSDAHSAVHTAWLNRDELDAARGDDMTDFAAALRRVEQERDELASAVAGWVARFHAAHEALAIDEFDGDSCPDLEATIEYAVQAYRRVCESEEAAADRIDRYQVELRLERDAQVQLRQRLIAAQTELASARAELEQPRAELAAERTELESWREHSKAQHAEIVRLEALVVARSTELAEARAATNQVVARADGRACHTCGQEIRRGEAYVYLDPEATPDDLAHVRCPDAGDRPAYGPESTVRTRDDDGNDHQWVIDETGQPTPTPNTERSTA